MDYSALIAQWATLGAAVVDQSRIDAAVTALAMPAPEPPERPDGLVEPETAAAYAEASRAYDVALADWHMGYAAIFHDAAVLAKLGQVNALTSNGPRRLVPIATVMEYLRTNNLWLLIKAAQGSSAGAAAAVDYNADLRAHSIDLDLPIVQTMLGDLVTHNLLSAEQRAAIDAMANSRLPWWQSAGFASPIGTGDLEAVFVQTGEVLV